VDILRVTHEIGAASTFETLAYCFPTALRWNGPQTAQWLEGFWKEDPTDFTLRVALGRYRTGAGRLEEAQGVLETCCRERPESLPAQAALLACYYEQNDWERIERTMRQLPPRAATEPWLLVRMRGQYHNHRGEFAEAIKCFQQMLAADPVNAESWKGLARAYEALQREQERHDALRRMQLSARLQSRLGAVLSKEDDVAPLLEAIELCKEAKLWSQARLVANAARRIDPDHVDVKKALENLPDEQ
jgi:tetratricopeptide (TPR) repeat protein